MIQLADLIFLLLKGNTLKNLLEFVKNRISLEVNENLVKKKLSLVLLKFRKLWREAGRKRDHFFKLNEAWIAGEFVVDIHSPSKSSGCRTSKTFAALTSKTKKKRIESILNQFSMEEILFAAATSVARAGFRKAGKLIQKLSENPDAAFELQRSAERSNQDVVALTAEEALAFLCKNDFSKAQYSNIRQQTIVKGVDIFPAYNKLVEAKKLCYPTGIQNN